MSVYVLSLLLSDTLVPRPQANFAKDGDVSRVEEPMQEDAAKRSDS